MKRAEKEVEISSLSERFKRAKAVILAEYRGLKVSEITEIRREVKKNSGEFNVIKNRLAKRAIQGSVWEPLSNHLKGPLALALSEKDPVVLSKILSKFAENFQALKIRTGCMDGKVLSTKDIEALAKLPSKEELYAKLLGTLMAPAGALVRVLHGVPQKLVVALKAVSERKE